MRKVALIVFALVWSVQLNAQHTDPKKLHERVNEFVFSDPEKALQYAQEELRSSPAGSEEHVIAEIDLAKCAYYADNYDEGEKRLFKALENAKKLDYNEGIAWASFHIGDLRLLEGKYGSAIQYLNSSYNLFEEQNNAEGEALSLNAIGLIYLDQEDFQKAQSFFKQALTTGNDITRGDSYTNLAQLYLNMEAYPKARRYAELAYKQAIANEDEYVKSTALDVLGSVALFRGELEKAEKHYRHSIRLKEHLMDQKGASASYLQLARIKQKMHQEDSVFFFTMRAFRLADEVGANKEIKDAAYALSKYYAHLGLYDSAFYYQNQFVELNESLMNEQVQKKMAQIEAEKTKKENELRISNMEHQEKLEHETTSFYLLLAIGGVIVLSGALYLFYYRYKVKKRSFESLETKNKVIEEQNHHILQSIRYAQRLQEAILPDAEVLQANFSNLFTIYLPKDIVAGDFYWYEQQKGHHILACCDSTGHGVPGAMVSVVCSNALNGAVVEHGLTDPGEILDATRLKVIESFNKSGGNMKNVKDGMDVTLLSIHAVTGNIRFAGAHHTLWVYRRAMQTFEFYKGDKQPIGIYEMNNNYRTHDIVVDKGDRVYLFTDGYADQFGGPQLKKLKNTNVQKLLLSLQEMDMSLQHEALLNYFNTWKGGEEQVDDVTVIGFEVA